MIQPPPHDVDRSADRKLLGFIAGLSLLILALIALGVILAEVKEAAYTLLGTIVGGLLVNSKDVIQAIKEAWQQRQVQRMTDQLGSSLPADTPIPAKIVNDVSEPVPTEEAK